MGVDGDAEPVSRRGEIYESDSVGMREKAGIRKVRFVGYISLAFLRGKLYTIKPKG